MNYLNFFQLKSTPFDKRSDGEFAFDSKSFNEGKARLELISQTGGIFHLYGEYGTGKSALLYRWARELPPKINYVYLNYVKVRAFGILFFISQGFSLPVKYSKVKLVCLLMDYFSTCSEKPVIIIDDAQSLANDTLEDIRMLTSLQFDTDMSFVLIFSSHFSFLNKLNGYQALKQRINLSYELLPLSKNECYDYLKQRIKAAGSHYYPFTQEAEEKIFEFSGGIIRKINKVATLALLIAASSAMKMADERVCESAIVELFHN